VSISLPYRYFAFGLEIESEIQIPELLPGNFGASCQVYIQISKVPEYIPNATFSGVRFQGSPDEFLLCVDNVARYHIKKGNTILIDPVKNASEKDIRLFLLGSAIGALIHQRGMLPFHGSSVIIHNRVVIFSGASGAGKSTLAAAFIKKGFPLITDDVCVITLNNELNPIVHPGYPQMKLWADSLEKTGHESHSLIHVRDGIKKFNLPVNLNFHTKSEALNGIYIISAKNTGGFNMETIKGIEKFNLIKNNTYRLNFLKGTGTTSSHFKHIEAISRLCFVKKIERPSKGFHLSDLTGLIEKDLTNE
jgi:GTP-binding protein EngB required for normal cell division